MFYGSRCHVDISPTAPTQLGCGPLELVEAPGPGTIEANLLLLEDTSNNRVLFVSIDALYVGPTLVGLLQQELANWLVPEQIFLTASHTHGAPMLDSTKPEMGLVDQGHLQRIGDQIVGRARILLEGEKTRVSLHPKRYEVRNGVFRRRILPLMLRKKSLTFMRAHSLPSLKPFRGVFSERIDVKSSDNGLFAAIWVMPMHPVGLPNQHEVNPHFVGNIRARVREANADPEISFIFLQGASGDIRPPAFHAAGNCRFFKEMKFPFRRNGSFTPEEYQAWLTKIWDEYCSATKIDNLDPLTDESSTISVDRCSFPLDDYFIYDLNVVGRREFVAQKIALGDFTLLGLSAEPTWAVSKQILRRSPNTSIVGCVGDVFGYLASPEQAVMGGYEVTGYQASFAVTKRKHVERRLLRQVHNFLYESNHL